MQETAPTFTSRCSAPSPRRRTSARPCVRGRLRRQGGPPRAARRRPRSPRAANRMPGPQDQRHEQRSVRADQSQRSADPPERERPASASGSVRAAEAREQPQGQRSGQHRRRHPWSPRRRPAKRWSRRRALRRVPRSSFPANRRTSSEALGATSPHRPEGQDAPRGFPSRRRTSRPTPSRIAQRNSGNDPRPAPRSPGDRPARTRPPSSARTGT